LPSSSSKTILEEAAGITTTDRNITYGQPIDNHGRTAEFWSTYLGTNITPEDVCWMMMLVKVSRNMHAPSRDNLVDMAGYARNIEMIRDASQSRVTNFGHLPYSNPNGI